MTVSTEGASGKCYLGNPNRSTAHLLFGELPFFTANWLHLEKDKLRSIITLCGNHRTNKQS